LKTQRFINPGISLPDMKGQKEKKKNGKMKRRKMEK